LFGKNNEPSAGKVDTIIGSGTHFNGSLNVEGTLRVDGAVDGEVKCNGDVIIGKTGVVRASIGGRNVTVAGEVQGDMVLEGKLEISATGKVLGDIEVDKLVISEGAIFKGKSMMQGNSPAAEKISFFKKDDRNKDNKKNNKENKKENNKAQSQ